MAELARRAGRSAGTLHGTTGGNPFYVTEVLASAGEEMPGSVRDAVLARARRLSPAAREVLEIVGVVPGRAETWLVEGGPGRPPGLAGGRVRGGGMLRARRRRPALPP